MSVDMKILTVQYGWEFDDLWEEGYRFDNDILNIWAVIPRDKANNKDEAYAYLLGNISDLKVSLLHRDNLNHLRKDIYNAFLEWNKDYEENKDEFIDEPLSIEDKSKEQCNSLLHYLVTIKN